MAETRDKPNRDTQTKDASTPRSKPARKRQPSGNKPAGGDKQASATKSSGEGKTPPKQRSSAESGGGRSPPKQRTAAKSDEGKTPPKQRGAAESGDSDKAPPKQRATAKKDSGKAPPKQRGGAKSGDSDKAPPKQRATAKKDSGTAPPKQRGDAKSGKQPDRRIPRINPKETGAKAPQTHKAAATSDPEPASWRTLVGAPLHKTMARRLHHEDHILEAARAFGKSARKQDRRKEMKRIAEGGAEALEAFSTQLAGQGFADSNWQKRRLEAGARAREAARKIRADYAKPLGDADSKKLVALDADAWGDLVADILAARAVGKSADRKNAGKQD